MRHPRRMLILKSVRPKITFTPKRRGFHAHPIQKSLFVDHDPDITSRVSTDFQRLQ